MMRRKRYFPTPYKSHSLSYWLSDKPAKTPRTGTKLKLSTPKNPESTKKTPKSKGSSVKKGKKAAAAASDDEAVSTPKAEEPKLTPAEQKEKSQKLGQYWLFPKIVSIHWQCNSPLLSP